MEKTLDKLNSLIYLILTDLKEGKDVLPANYEATKTEFNQAVDTIDSEKLADSVVVVKGGIGNEIKSAILANAKINYKGLKFLEDNKEKYSK